MNLYVNAFNNNSGSEFMKEVDNRQSTPIDPSPGWMKSFPDEQLTVYFYDFKFTSCRDRFLLSKAHETFLSAYE